MGLFSSLFGKKKEKDTVSKTGMVDLFQPFFAKDLGELEDNNVVQEAIYSVTPHASKLSMVHYRNKEGKKAKVDTGGLNHLLKCEPNSIENGADFLEKAMYHYLISNNVFIYLDFDVSASKGRPKLKNLWVINPYTANVKVLDNGEVYLTFYIENDTRKVTTSIDNVAHIKRNVGPDEFFGSDNEGVKKVLKVIDTNYQGIEHAVKQSAFIRFIVESTTVLSEEKKKAKAEQFAKEFLQAKENGGVIFSDAASKVTQVTNNPKYANFREMEHFDHSVFSYFGTNSKIVTKNYNDTEWNAFFESTIAPFANKMELELTRKIFSHREIAEGNMISIDTDRLSTMSIQNRLNVMKQSKDIGLMTLNEMREMLSLPPIEGGDDREVSLNYVKGSEQSDYQGDGSSNSDPEDDEDDDNEEE